MRFVIAALISVLTCVSANAHELTPTYPKLTPSVYDGVLKTTMTLFNRRNDVFYYQIEVYDKDWKNIDFATEYKVLSIKYLEKKTFDIYIKSPDAEYVTYICTRSRILKGDKTSLIASNVCSKVK